MAFDDLILEESPSSNREIVKLAIYYLDQIEELDGVSTSDINELISKSRTGNISSSSIAAHLRHMNDDGVISKNGHGPTGGYQISLREMRKLPEGFEASSGGREDSEFIETFHLDDHFYNELIEDINKSFESGIDEATLVLTRKLLENLLIDILRTRYGLEPENIDLFYNTDERQFRRFSVLIENLESNISDIEYFSDRVDDEFTNLLQDLKGGGDASAHSIEISPSEDDMREYQDKANEVVNTLSYALKAIRASE